MVYAEFQYILHGLELYTNFAPVDARNKIFIFVIRKVLKEPKNSFELFAHFLHLFRREPNPFRTPTDDLPELELELEKILID